MHQFVTADFLPEVPDAFAGLADDPDEDFVELPEYIPRSRNSIGHFSSR
jgi:hypothetical protein